MNLKMSGFFLARLCGGVFLRLRVHQTSYTASICSLKFTFASVKLAPYKIGIKGEVNEAI